MKKNLLIIGAGGFGALSIDALYRNHDYESIGLLDDNKIGESLLGFPVLGSIDVCEELKGSFTHAVVTIDQAETRMALISRLEALGYEIASIIHPRAFVSPYARIGKNTLAFAGAIINPATTLGDGVIVNTAAVVEHDNNIGSGVHISPNAATCGVVTIGRYSWICAGSTIAPYIKIGERSIVAAGSTVIHDVPDGVMVAGAPAALKKHLETNRG